MTNVEKDIFLMKLINRNDIIADKDGDVYRKKVMVMQKSAV